MSSVQFISSLFWWITDILKVCKKKKPISSPVNYVKWYINALLLIFSLCCCLWSLHWWNSRLDDRALLLGGVNCNTHINHRIIGRVNAVFRNTALAAKNTAQLWDFSKHNFQVSLISNVIMNCRKFWLIYVLLTNQLVLLNYQTVSSSMKKRQMILRHRFRTIQIN